jgi:uncharacterized membrane protein YkoI
MNRRTRIAASALLGVGLIAGGFGAAAAVSGDGEDDHDEPRITGSVTAPAEDETMTDAEEDAGLAALATISAEEAGAAAVAAVGGTVTMVEIDDEDGFVVYDVDVRTDSGIVEVTVDAGDGTVLADERDDDHDDGRDED